MASFIHAQVTLGADPARPGRSAGWTKVAVAKEKVGNILINGAPPQTSGYTPFDEPTFEDVTPAGGPRMIEIQITSPIVFNGTIDISVEVLA